jgi:putative ABC transport system permease protein
MHDLRVALRSLAKRRTFSLVAILTLGLGIGANSAMFSVVNTVLLKAAPYPEAERLVMVWASNPEAARNLGLPDQLPQTAAAFLDYAAETRTLERMAMLRSAPTNLTDGEPEVLGGVAVTGEFFRLLGVKAALGRALEPSDELPQASPAVVLSHAFWRRRFGGDPSVVGREIRLDGRPRTVVGVMPEGFAFPRAGEILAAYEFADRPDVWLPLTVPPDVRQQRSNRGNVIIARRRAGISRDQAQAEMETIARRLAREYPATDAGWGVRLDPFRRQLVGQVETSLLMLFGALGIVLLVACGNVASLMLAEARARRKEVAVRSALGANRSQLLRPLLAESLVLAAAGGALGLVIGRACLSSLLALVPVTVPGAAETKMDVRVLLFTAAACLLSVVVFGVLPGLVTWRTDASSALREATRGSVRGGRRTLTALVAAQMTLAIVLLVGAGLLLRSFARLLDRETGLTREPVLTFHIELPGNKYPRAAVATLTSELIDRLRALPGVAAAGVTSGLPFSGSESLEPLRIEGRPDPEPGKEVYVDARVVTSGYFTAMGIPLRSGRLFDERDGAEAPPVVVISETLARTFWPAEDPLGRRLRYGFDEDWRTVVGVVGDVRHSGLQAQMRGHVYETQSQGRRRDLYVAVRTHGDAVSLASPVRQVLASLDPEQPIEKMRSLQEVIAESMAGRRFDLLLLALFAALALVLSAIGLYGLASNSVAQRTREIGLRLALGATPRRVQALILGDAARAVGWGAGLGLLVAIAAGRAIASLLFATSPSDPLTYASVLAVLVLVALLATALPLRMAVRLDPGVTLREE